MATPIEVLEVQAAQLQPAPLLRRLHDDELQALIFRGFYPSETLDHVRKRLEAMAEHPLWQHRDHPDPKRRQTRVFGQPTSPSDVHREGPEPDAYFEDAVRFRQTLAELFPTARPFETELQGLLRSLSGDAQVAAAQDEQGRTYGVATVRCMPRGVGLPPHCENDYLHIPIYKLLQEHVQLPKHLSFFMPLALPDGGGELVIHERRWQGPSGAGDLREFLKEPHRTLDLAVGDLVVFAASRVFHSVMPAQGPNSRWTVGGFGGFSSDDQSFVHWA